ncbi:NAD(P)-dependent oxidoreductase [Novosphingobium sp. TH158]|uniref:NAD-dependent epimerase/dehydratase family protein n=1 Tax=Novosphingobium sp. TH158 TaxID=2067455 RepID=UPI000C7C9026|nr:NAD(P)-dependent oxidoreductase [Novosphingobium sp. TH158]PLK26770.1 NAD(P)-dependent oxidoreductase [Novosphingobium sp. TH158]
MILVTGSAGLIGTAVLGLLAEAGIAARGFDMREDAAQDTRNSSALAEALDGATGVVHLAAVSRVVWAQNDPDLTQQVNVEALRSLIGLMQDSPLSPWLIFASSREVYGEQARLPVVEDDPLEPLNTYARSKVAGEEQTAAARGGGMRAQTVRFSNVYGSTADHEDRVVPAFARTAALGGELRIDGSENLFDFTHVDDAALGLFKAIVAMIEGRDLPSIHFLTGKGTTLGELAAMAVKEARRPVTLREAPPRRFDVARFVGDPSRARELLGWEAKIPVEAGFARLVDDFAKLAEADGAPAVASAR